MLDIRKPAVSHLFQTDNPKPIPICGLCADLIYGLTMQLKELGVRRWCVQIHWHLATTRHSKMQHICNQSFGKSLKQGWLRVTRHLFSQHIFFRHLVHQPCYTSQCKWTVSQHENIVNSVTLHQTDNIFLNRLGKNLTGLILVHQEHFCLKFYSYSISKTRMSSTSITVYFTNIYTQSYIKYDGNRYV